MTLNLGTLITMRSLRWLIESPTLLFPTCQRGITYAGSVYSVSSFHNGRAHGAVSAEGGRLGA